MHVTNVIDEKCKKLVARVHGKTILVFVEDPDGYKIELLGIK